MLVTDLCMAILQSQHCLSNVQASSVLVKGIKHAQQTEAISTIQVLHHNVQVVPAGEAVIEPHLHQSMHCTKLAADSQSLHSASTTDAEQGIKGLVASKYALLHPDYGFSHDLQCLQIPSPSASCCLNASVHVCYAAWCAAG